MMECDRCKSTESVEEHHIIPKSIGNKSMQDGGRIWLCRKCHIIIHSSLLGVIFHAVLQKDQDRIKEHIKEYTEWWVKHDKPRI